MKSILKYGTAPGKNVLEFPRVFFFFDYIIKRSPSIQPLRELRWIFYHIQVICLPLMPFFTQILFNNKKEGIFAKIYCLVMTYNTYDSINEKHYISVLPLVVFSMVLFLFMLLAFQFFKNKGSLPLWVSVAQVILFDIHPFNIFFPLMHAIGFDAFIILSDRSIQSMAIVSLTICSLVLIALMMFYYWCLPLIFAPQFQFKQNISTTIMEGVNIFWTTLLFMLVITITIASKSTAAVLETQMVLFVFSIYRFVQIWVKPSNNVIRFWSLMTAYLVSTISSVLVTVYIHIAFVREYYFLLILLGIWAICAITSVLLIRRKHRQIDLMIETSNFSKSHSRDVLYICQRALHTSKVTTNILNMIYDYYAKNSNLDNLITLIATTLVYDVHKQDLDVMITMLANSPNLPRMKLFLVYELYKKYTNSTKLVCLLSGVEKIDQKVQEYKNLSDKFWKATMLGQTAAAIKHVGFLKVLQDDLSYDYRIYESFFPSHSKIHTLYNEFFKKFLMKPDTRLSDLSKYSISEDFLVSDITDGSSSVHSSSDSSSDEELRNSQQQWINENIKKLIQKSLNIPLTILSIVIWVATVVIYYYLITQPVSSKKITSTYQYIPETLFSIQKITVNWLKITYLLDAFKTDMEPLNFTYQQVKNLLFLPNTTYCSTAMSIYENLSSIIDELQRDLGITEHRIVSLENDEPGFIHLKENWFGPKVDLLNFTLSLDELYSTTSAQLMAHENDKSKHDFIEYVSQNWDYLFNINEKTEASMSYTLSNLSSFIKGKENHTSVISRQKIYISIGIILFCVLLTVILAWAIVQNFGRIIIKHFRPTNHPNSAIEIQLSDKIDSNVCSPMFIGIVLTYLLVMGIFIGIYFILSKEIQDFAQEIYKYSEAVINIQNITLKLGLLQSHFIEDIQENKFNLSSFQDYIYNSGTILLQSLQSIYFSKYRGELLYHYIDDYKCTVTIDSTPVNLFRCWSSTITYNFYVYYSNIINTEKYVDPRDFAHMQFLYLDVILNDLMGLSQKLLNLSHSTSLEYEYVEHVSIGVLCFLTIFIFFVFYQILFSNYVIETQLGRQIAALSPMFIVQHQCLVSYVADLSEEEKTEKEILPFFEIYDSSGVAVVALNEKLSIIAFTKEVLKIFGYKPQQLYGQNIETIVPLNDKVWKNNDKKFYRQIELAQNHEAAARFSRTVTGCCSDRTPVDLKTSVSYVETTSGKFFVIEFRSIARETFYEEQYINSSKLINQYRSSAMPIMLFTDDPALNRRMTIKETLKVRYKHYAAVYVGLIIDENFEMPDLNESSFSPMKDILSLSTPLYSGVSGALVIDATCETALIIFVNDEDSDAHLHNAIGFSLDFSEKNIYPTHGVIIEGEDLDVSLHPLPDIPESENSNSRQIRPQMSIEPSSDVMQKLSNVIQLAIENCLILPTSAADLIAEVPSLPFSNDLGLDLSFIEIKVSSYIT